MHLRRADVGVVDVAVDDEGHPAVRMLAPADGIRQLAEREQIGLGQQPEGFAPVEGYYRFDFVLDGFRSNAILMPDTRFDRSGFAFNPPYPKLSDRSA